MFVYIETYNSVKNSGLAHDRWLDTGSTGLEPTYMCETQGRYKLHWIMIAKLWSLQGELQYHATENRPEQQALCESWGLIPYTRGTPETDRQPHKQWQQSNKKEWQEYIGTSWSRNGSTNMEESERATTRITDTDLEGAASTLEEATAWKQLSQEMKYIRTSVTSGGTATARGQHQHQQTREQPRGGST